MAVDSSPWVREVLRCAVSDEMLVLMVWAMDTLLEVFRHPAKAPADHPNVAVRCLNPMWVACEEF